jgi:tetratricopeptide (TPR) repeat protein
MESIPEHGRLDEIPLPRLLLGLQRQQFGGAVTLSRERVGKRFLFRDGLPIFAESNLASESLGVQLMDAGRITRSDYNRLISHVASEACKEGKALLDLGLLDAKGLFLALKDQVRIRLLECFGWPHGEFFVEAGCEPPADAQPFRAEIFSLLQEGIETHWSSDRVLADLHTRMELFPELSARSKQIAAKLRSDDAVVALLSALDGTRTLWRVIQTARSPRGLAAIWVLDAAGALQYRDAAKPDSDLAGADGGGAAAEVEIVTLAEPEVSPAPRPAAAPPRHKPNETDVQATAKLRSEIGAKHARLAELDYYQLLELPADCDAAAIKHAYHVAAKIYHPDTLARSGLDADARAEANRVFAEISKAHATLSDPQRRALYDEERSGAGSGIDANRLANAENFYRKGEILMRQGNFRGAFEFLKPAVDLWPDECAYQSALGWTYYKKTPSEPEVARQHLEKALALDAEDGVTLFRLGVVLRAMGQTEAGAAAHERASRLGGRDR